MEAVRFSICNTCSGSGQTDQGACPTCFGAGSFYFGDNNFLYWDKEINYVYIFVRELKKVINILINGLLILGVLGTLVSLYFILDGVQFEPRNLWVFLKSIHELNLWLWFFILMDTYLYYRLARASYDKKIKKILLKNKNKFARHNIADSLSAEVSTYLDKAWLYAAYKKITPITVWHLLYVLLDDKDVRLVLARLGVGAQNIKSSIDQNLAELTRTDQENFYNTLLNAYLHSLDRYADKVAEIDILAGLVMSSQAVRNFFYDFDIDEQKIDNVITWVNINKQLTHRYQFFRSRASFRPKGDVNRAYTAIATPLLDSFSQDLTRLARAGYLPISVGREKEINELTNMVESDYASVVLVGPSGVGKTAIIEGLANHMMAEDVPEIFQDKRLVSVSIPMLVSGAAETGRMEERFLSILNEAAVSGNIILYFENIHNLIGVSSASTQGIDLSEVLAQEIRKRNVIVLASTTNKDYVQYIEGKELGQSLKKINIQEPDKNQTIKIMEAHVGNVEAKYRVYFTYDSLEKIYDLSDRYLADLYLPRKALDLMDEAAVQVSKEARPDKLVRAEDIASLVSYKTNIPLTQVTAQESQKLLSLESEIHERIVGQDEAVTLVASALRRARAELRDQKRPIVNLLFLGPTGVGKTELAKTVAEKYFGSEENMIRLDMSEYQTQNSLPRLIGSAENATAGLLTEAVRHKPFALLLLDEMEKAHPDILNIFLQVMEDGRLTDALGKTVSFTNLILVATSNAGTSFIQDQINAGKSIDEFKDDLIKNKIRDNFSPEFINRFDSVVVFRPLNQDEIFQIAGLLLKKVAKRLEEKGVFFEWTKEAQSELARAGFDPVFGARPLRRVVQERVDNALANFLLTGKLGRRDIVVYDMDDQIRIKKAQGF